MPKTEAYYSQTKYFSPHLDLMRDLCALGIHIRIRTYGNK